MSYPSEDTFEAARQSPYPPTTTPAYDYRSEVLRNLNPEFVESAVDQLNLGGLGLISEAGECSDLVKKFLFHEGLKNRTMEVFNEKYRAKLLKELGDVRWYFEVLCHVAGTTIEEVEKLNVEKLRARHPNGFSTASQAAKADEAPKCIGLDKVHVDGNCPAHAHSYLGGNCKGCGWRPNAGHAAGCKNMPKESTSGAV